jgi:hypothetical protein
MVETAMKYLLSVMMAAGFFCIAVAAFAQSTAPQAAPPPAPLAAAAALPSAPGAAAGGKRAGCLGSVEGKQGQDRQDAMHLCLAEARVDCLKEAIEQKVAKAQRRDFVRTCMKEG